MRAFLIALIFTSAFCAQIRVINETPKTVEVEGTFDDIKNFAAGFALSARVLEKVPDALACGSSASALKAAVKASIALIKTGNFDNVVHGVQKLTAAVADSAQTCGDTSIEGKNYVVEVVHIVKGTKPSYI